MTPEQAQEITRLRSLNLSPKQIARNLGLRPAEVTEYIRKQAEAATQEREVRGELPPLEHCLVNESAYRRFFGTRKTGWLKKNSEDEGIGFAQVVVVRKERNDYTISGFLVDFLCLGVKDALYHRRIDQRKYEYLLDTMSDNFQEDFQEITLEQAQAIVFNGVDYAGKLGFKPHADFEQARKLLGPRMENLPDLQAKFGENGKPFYVCGPYDKPEKIIATLKEHVGEGNFSVMLPSGDVL